MPRAKLAARKAAAAHGVSVRQAHVCFHKYATSHRLRKDKDQDQGVTSGRDSI